MSIIKKAIFVVFIGALLSQSAYTMRTPLPHMPFGFVARELFPVSGNNGGINGDTNHNSYEESKEKLQSIIINGAQTCQEIDDFEEDLHNALEVFIKSAKALNGSARRKDFYFADGEDFFSLFLNNCCEMRRHNYCEACLKNFETMTYKVEDANLSLKDFIATKEYPKAIGEIVHILAYRKKNEIFDDYRKGNEPALFSRQAAYDFAGYKEAVSIGYMREFEPGRSYRFCDMRVVTTK